ncbi:tol-pal system-associated acyl-CoA thioesterase [Elioraea rosea]|uniref:tol-pal system-associated acyl-CoA thioesterase n=1 Tax=Elioraea rosea TaxID=2492390 RepID=UPI0011830FF0|nr:tol-pal system-associated acyl-CoA thioesterase [Elioraea rosea]
MEPEAHRFQLRVYFEDTDAGGVVYHASYLRFAERARTEYLRDLGLPHQQLIARDGLIFVVKSLSVEYHRPARLDDSLVVATRVSRLGGASLDLAQGVFRSGESGEEAVASLAVGLVCVRAATLRPERIPAALRGLLGPHRGRGSG